MGVLSTKDFEEKNKGVKSNDVDKPNPNLKKNKATIKPDTDTFEYFRAPMGKSTIGFVYKGEEKHIDLIDKRYIVDKKVKGQARHDLIEMLKSAGLVHVDSTTTYKMVEKPEDKDVIYKLGHPDNEPDNKKEGAYSIRFKDEDISMEIIDGVVEVKDKDLADELMKKGFYSLNAK